jgi:hypothetical protein
MLGVTHTCSVSRLRVTKSACVLSHLGLLRNTKQQNRGTPYAPSGLDNASPLPLCLHHIAKPIHTRIWAPAVPSILRFLHQPSILFYYACILRSNLSHKCLEPPAISASDPTRRLHGRRAWGAPWHASREIHGALLRQRLVEVSARNQQWSERSESQTSGGVWGHEVPHRLKNFLGCILPRAQGGVVQGRCFHVCRVAEPRHNIGGAWGHTQRHLSTHSTAQHTVTAHSTAHSTAAQLWWT